MAAALKQLAARLGSAAHEAAGAELDVREALQAALKERWPESAETEALRAEEGRLDALLARAQRDVDMWNALLVEGVGAEAEEEDALDEGGLTSADTLDEAARAQRQSQAAAAHMAQTRRLLAGQLEALDSKLTAIARVRADKEAAVESVGRQFTTAAVARRVGGPAAAPASSMAALMDLDESF